MPARHVRRRFTTAYKPQVKKLDQENRRLQKAEALLAFQKSFRAAAGPGQVDLLLSLRDARALRQRTPAAGGSTAVWINPPTKNTTAQDAPGTTIATSDDLRVDHDPDADDHSAIVMTEGGATLITSPLVSQCY